MACGWYMQDFYIYSLFLIFGWARNTRLVRRYLANSAVPRACEKVLGCDEWQAKKYIPPIFTPRIK